MKVHDEKIWVATFGEVTKYMRERMSASAKTETVGEVIKVNLTHELDPKQYDIALTLKTYVDPSWKQVRVKQGDRSIETSVSNDAKGAYVQYDANPNGLAIELSAL
jgi:hypothetical protein